MRSRASTSIAATPPASIACDELGARREREIRAAPQAEPLGIGEIVDGGGAGRRDIERRGHRAARAAGASPARPCCDGAWSPRSLFSPAAFCIAWLSSKTITPSKSRPKPIDDLLHARSLALARVGAQRGVGGEQDAFVEPDRRALPEAGERRDQEPLLAERRPVALGVLDQLVGLRDPDGAAAALQPIVEDDAGDLAALAGAGAVAEKPAAAEADGVLGIARARPRRHRRSRRRSTNRRGNPECASPA